MKKTTDKPARPNQPNAKNRPEAPGRHPSRETKESRDMPKDQDQYATIPGANQDEWHTTRRQTERDDFDDYFDEEE
jgi:hypothetical protein